MKLSTKGRYGLRAVLDIAINEGEGKYISIHDIAKRQDISQGYLERIISKLKKADIVKSERGAQGGYILAKETKNISAYDVLSVLETSIDISDCVSEVKQCDCKNISNCITRMLWQRINNETIKILKETSVEELMKGAEGIC